MSAERSKIIRGTLKGEIKTLLVKEIGLAAPFTFLSHNVLFHISNIRAKAIQSVLQLKDPSTFKFDAYGRLDLLTANRKETNDPDFAEKILNMWKTKFTEFVNQLNEEKKYKSKMLAFSTKSFEGLIHDFSNINKKYNAYTGLGILVSMKCA